MPKLSCGLNSYDAKWHKIPKKVPGVLNGTFSRKKCRGCRVAWVPEKCVKWCFSVSRKGGTLYMFTSESWQSPRFERDLGAFQLSVNFDKFSRETIFKEFTSWKDSSGSLLPNFSSRHSFFHPQLQIHS